MSRQRAADGEVEWKTSHNCKKKLAETADMMACGGGKDQFSVAEMNATEQIAGALLSRAPAETGGSPRVKDLSRARLSCLSLPPQSSITWVARR